MFPVVKPSNRTQQDPAGFFQHEANRILSPRCKESRALIRPIDTCRGKETLRRGDGAAFFLTDRVKDYPTCRKTPPGRLLRETVVFPSKTLKGKSLRRMERGASWLLKFDLRNGFSKECSKVMRKLSVRLLFVMLLAGGVLAWSQATTGSISGHVTDPAGSVLQGAQIAVHDVDTGIVTTATTDQSGEFTLTALPPGHYTITFGRLDLPLRPFRHLNSASIRRRASTSP